MSYKQLLKSSLRVPVEAMAANFGAHKRQAKSPRLWILMYHRILPQNDPRYAKEEPGMLVDSDTFRRQLKILKGQFTLISLQEWIDRYQQNRPLPEKACAITLDDGWLDNFEYAFPILSEEQVPATLFAVSHMIGTNQQFWPNRLAQLFKLPREALVEIRWLKDLLAALPATNELSAQAIYSLKKYTDNQIIDWLADAEVQLNIPKPTEPELVNWQQLRQISDNDLFDIGSHTCHHIRLRDDLASDIMLKEISDSKKKLESELDKPINLFCYPNGDHCTRAVDMVTQTYQAAVTTQRGIIAAPGSSMHTLARIGLHEDMSNNKRRLLARLANWPI